MDLYLIVCKKEKSYKYESAHLSLTSQNKKRKKTKGALTKRNKRKMKNLATTSTRSWTHEERVSKVVAWW